MVRDDKVADIADFPMPSFLREHNLYSLIGILIFVYVAAHTDFLPWISLKLTQNYWHGHENIPFIAAGFGTAIVAGLFLMLPFA